MKFEKLHVHAFGHFTDFSVRFDQDRTFHVLYGENEAGKSTLLRSITQLLYGIPHNSKDSFLHSNSQLRIEGTITKQNSDSLTFVRRKGKSKTLLDSLGQPLADHALYAFLQGLPEDTFKTMFALNHETLREGGETLLESGGNAGESLFAAASGINTIKSAMDTFENNSKALYKPGGSKPPINEQIRKEKELTRKIAETIMPVREWNELEHAYKKGQQEIAELKEQAAELEARLTKMKKWKNAAPKVVEREGIKSELEAYRDIPDLRPDCTVLRETLTKTIKEAEERVRMSNDEAKLLEEDIRKVHLNDRLIEQEAALQSLYSGIEAFNKEKQELVGYKANGKQQFERLQSLLQRSGFSDLSTVNVEDLRLSASREERIKALQQKQIQLTEKKDILAKRLKELEENMRKKREEIDQIGELSTTGNLKLSFSIAQEEGRLEENLNRAARETAELREEIESGLSNLPCWTGTFEEFTAFHVPILDETIQGFINEETRIKNERDQAWQNIHAEEKRIEQAEKQLQELDGAHEVPTEEVLFEKRALRDTGWELIKGTLEGKSPSNEEIKQYAENLNLASRFEKHLKETDSVSDQLRAESEKVGTKKKLLDDLALSRKTVEEAHRKEKDLADELTILYDQWQAHWKSIAIDPLSPSEMKEWMARYTGLRQTLVHYQKKKQSWNELADKLTAIKHDLAIKLAAVSGEHLSLEKMTFVQIMRFVKGFLDKETDRAAKKTALKQNYENKQQEYVSVKGELDELKVEIADWSSSWEKMIEPLKIPADASVLDALEQLERYGQIVKSYDEWKENETKAERCESYIKSYTEKVKKVTDSLSHEFPLDIEPYIYKLYNDLKRQLELKQSKEQWNNQLKKKQIELNQLEEKLKKDKLELDDLLAEAGAKSLQELTQIEMKYGEKQKLQRDMDHLNKWLLEMGQGQALEEFITEIVQLDLEELEKDMVTLEMQLEDIDKNRSHAEQAFGVCKKEYEEKIQGQTSRAAETAEEREGVLAELSLLAEQYVQQKLAAIYLSSGIEYYRSKNQNPIINRASDIFRKLTLGSFEGLMADYNEKDEAVLVGVREGEKMAIDAMSDGTKDQLYLSLRIASIEKYCAENEPVPFIVDDILVHFDNERSMATIEILEELSKSTQIIFFTHHHHLIELFQQALKEESYQFIELQKKMLIQ